MLVVDEEDLLNCDKVGGKVINFVLPLGFQVSKNLELNVFNVTVQQFY